MNRRQRSSLRRNQPGFMLIALLALLAMGGLYFLISNLTPEAIEARRQAKTAAALVQAREALLGYALKHRDEEAGQGRPDRMYGYLPLPDLGSLRNQNIDPNCRQDPNDINSPRLEGCDANTPTDIVCNPPDPNNIYPTIIGRLPWRTLGTGPLRDGHGECLWLIVSSLHLRKQCSNPTLPPMNWDTLGQLDIVTANSTNALNSALAIHDRPVAIIFSPGPPLPGQDRSNLGGHDVSECGGNYNAANYIDPAIDPANPTPLGGVTNYLAGTSYLGQNNHESGATGDSDTSNDPDDALKKSMLVQGKVFKSGTNYLPGSCAGSDCNLLANDVGLPITSDLLFGAIRKSSYFRTDINAMLERMSTCLRDQIAALGGANFPLDANSAGLPASPTDKTAGRMPTSACYNDTQNPLGYFSHYKDQFFVAACPTPAGNNCFTVTDTKNTVTLTDDTSASCPAVVIFSSQRGAGQSRSTSAERNTPANYLEGTNLTGFITNGALNFAGPSLFAQVSAAQAIHQDIVRCIPTGASLTVVAPAVPVSTFAGAVSLADYSAATRTLTLGSADVSSNYGANAASLFACAWTPEAHAGDGGFRSYFRFRVRRVGEGFTFAVIDGDRNGADVCGAARQHLGYSGYNGITPYIQPPKLAIEFDFSRNCNSIYFDANGHPACTFVEAAYTDSNTLNNGRNDPCYTCGIGTTDRHIAVVYWGYGSALNYPTQDDNVHDQADDNSGATPSTPMPTDPSPRPAPRNPAPVLPYVSDPVVIPGVAPLNRNNFSSDMSQREFHARVEVTRTFTAPVDAKEGRTGVEIKFWIEPQPAMSISAMSYNAGSPPTLSVTAASHGLNTGGIVVIRDAVPAGYNGEYPVTVINANSFTATLPSGTANPGPYISSMTWDSRSRSSPPLPPLCQFFNWDCVTVNSANHGLNTGNSITVSGAIPVEYNGTYTIFRIDANSYWFPRNLSYQPGPLPPAVATAKALAPRAQALTNTTRPMSQLYPGTTPDTTFNPLVADTATVYDEQTVACGAGCLGGQTCGSDNMCYRPSFRNLRLGFTLSERPTTGTGSNSARGQLIEITDRVTTWLP